MRTPLWVSVILVATLSCARGPDCGSDDCQVDGGGRSSADGGGRLVADAGGGAGSDSGTGVGGGADGGGARDAGRTGTATALTLSGPSRGPVGSPSRSFVVGLNGTLSAPLTVTVAANDGSLTPSTVVLTPNAPQASFRYSPSTAGLKTVVASTAGALASANIGYTATGDAATAYWVEGPQQGAVGVASEPFTVGANGTLGGPTTAHVGTFLGGGTSTPGSFTLSPAAPLATFTFTPLRAEFSGLAVGGGSLAQVMTGYSALSTPATQLTLTYPTGGLDGVASTDFEIRANGDLPMTPVTVMPSDGNGGGTFMPASLALSYSLQSVRFAYTPRGPGTRSIALSNSAALMNPAAVSYVVTANPATTVTLTGPARGPVAFDSASFRVGVDAVLSGPITVTLGAADGAFSPASVALTPSDPSALVRYSAANAGTKTIVTQNTGGLANASAVYLATTDAATTLWVEGPGVGPVGAASTNFTVGVDGALTGPVTVMFGLIDSQAIFTPSQVALGPSALTGTFTLTAPQAGFVHVSVSNTGGFFLRELGYTAR